MLSDNEKKKLLEGLDKIYANRPQSILEEEPHYETVMIGEYKARKISGSFEDYAKSNGLVNVKDVQWSR